MICVNCANWATLRRDDAKRPRKRCVYTRLYRESRSDVPEVVPAPSAFDEHPHAPLRDRLAVARGARDWRRHIAAACGRGCRCGRSVICGRGVPFGGGPRRRRRHADPRPRPAFRSPGRTGPEPLPRGRSRTISSDGDLGTPVPSEAILAGRIAANPYGDASPRSRRMRVWLKNLQIRLLAQLSQFPPRGGGFAEFFPRNHSAFRRTAFARRL
jgi:hypothetical protein